MILRMSTLFLRTLREDPADAEVVAALQAQGSRVVCYISVGSWEDWRPDADQFPAAVIGCSGAGGASSPSVPTSAAIARARS